MVSFWEPYIGKSGLHTFWFSLRGAMHTCSHPHIGKRPWRAEEERLRGKHCPNAFHKAPPTAVAGKQQWNSNKMEMCPISTQTKSFPYDLSVEAGLVCLLDV